MTTKTLPIDKSRFLSALNAYNDEHGTTLAELSRSMGYADNFLSATSGQGRISTPASRLLEVMYGVKYEDYCPRHEAPAPDAGEYRAAVQFDLPQRRVTVCITTPDGRDVQARAIVKDPGDEMSVLQAVSYAAHMCYKFAEQRRLAGPAPTRVPETRPTTRVPETRPTTRLPFYLP